jgi:DNA-binding NarL/FixJ family response regulator
MSVDPPIRVLVVGPTLLRTASLAALVREGGFTVVGERRNLERRSELDAVDVVVLAAGTALTVDAFSHDEPGIVIVGLDDSLMEVLSRNGVRATGVVPADADATTLRAAIGAVAAGLSVRPPELSMAKADHARPRSALSDDGVDPPVDVEPLTAREADVLDSLAQGLSNRAIATRLGISEHTVKFHLVSIFGKLGATTRTGAVRRALRRGLIDL